MSENGGHWGHSKKVRKKLTVVPKTDLWQSGSRLKTNQTVEFMSHNIHNPQGVGNCQDPCDVDLSLPAQSAAGALWNSLHGRRAFLKKTGGATLATALALHGTRIEVLASVTGQCIYVQKLVMVETFMNNTSGNPIGVNAQGFGPDSLAAHQAAVADLAFFLSTSGQLNSNATPNPAYTYDMVCQDASITGTTTTRIPESNINPTETDNQPFSSDSDLRYKETISYTIPTGYSSLIVEYEYECYRHFV